MRNISKNITAGCEALIVGLLIAAVVAIPLFFDIRLYSVFDLSKLMALYVLTIAILVVWSIALVLKTPVLRLGLIHAAIDIPILAYIFIFIISSITSINPIMSLFGTYKRFEGLTATLCYILIFYATVNFITTKKRAYWLIIAIVAGGAISSSYGIAQHLGFDMFKWSSFEARRVFSTFGNPVFFSAYLVTTLPVAVALFLRKSFQQRNAPVLRKSHIFWVFFAIASIIYTAFWLTNTRACFMALIGGLVPFLFLIFRRQSHEKYKFFVLVASFTLIGIFFNIQYDSSIVKRFIERFTEEKKTNNQLAVPSHDKKGIEALPIAETTQFHERPWIARKLPVSESSFSRIFQYSAAIEIIKDYPALGIGPDTIGIVYQKNLAKVYSVLESDRGFPFPRQDRIHNDILDTAATRGIFGLGTYIWLLAAFGIYVGRNYKRLNDRNKMLVLGLLAGIVCYLIQNEFSFGNTPIVTLFWVMVGLCISIIKINEAEAASSIEDKGLKIKIGGEDERLRGREGVRLGTTQLPRFPSSRMLVFCKWIGCGMALVALGFSTVFIIRFYRADAYFEYGRRILEYEKENLPATTEKGLFFMKHAIRLNPYETFYRDELCRTYLQNAFKTKDEAWLQKAYIEANNSLKLIPQHYMGFFHLGMIYQFMAEHFGRNTSDQAIACYQKAIESDPFQAPFHSNLASLYLNKGLLDQAIEELCRAYLIRPEELNHADRLANAFLQKGDLDKSLYFSRKTVALNPTEPGYYNNLGAILSKKGMYEEAIVAFKKAAEINPKEPIYLDNLAKLYLSLGKYDELIPYYKKLIEINPSDADYHNNLGAVYKRKKQPEDALQSFQKAVTLKPDNPVYTHNLASEFADLGKLSEAKDMLQAFNKTYPDHNYGNMRLLLANLYSQEADWEKVVSECERAIKTDDKSPVAYRMLGLAYYNLHQYELAKETLNKLLVLDPTDQGAKDLIAKISNAARR